MNDKANSEKGREAHHKLFGDEGRQRVESLGELGDIIFEFAYGGIISREGLSLKSREMLTVAMLTVLGREAELKTHMQGALNVGVTPEELQEIILHSIPYNGIPTATSAFHILQEVLSGN